MESLPTSLLKLNPALPSPARSLAAAPVEAKKQVREPANSSPNDSTDIRWDASPSSQAVGLSRPQTAPNGPSGHAPVQVATSYTTPVGTNGPLAQLESSAPWATPVVEGPSALLLDNLMSSIVVEGPFATANLLASLGVKPGQRTGADFRSGLTGEKKAMQRTEWQAGQIADLLGKGRADWAKEIASGHHGRLVGQSVYPKLEGMERGDREFASRFESAGWSLTSSVNARRPSDLKEQEVAFRAPDDQGEIREHRGVVVAGKASPYSAIFSLQGSEEEFNANSLRGLALKMEGAREPKPPATEAPLESKGPGAVPREILSTLPHMPAYLAKGVLEEFGVQPNQSSGNSFDSTLVGDAKAGQLQSWKLGQMADLLERGRNDLARSVLSGTHDALAGTSLHEALS